MTEYYVTLRLETRDANPKHLVRKAKDIVRVLLIAGHNVKVVDVSADDHNGVPFYVHTDTDVRWENYER